MKVKVLTESLDELDKKKVDEWHRPHHSFSDHAFGGTDLRTIVPLEHPIKSEHLQSISDHLEKHGYKMHDYVAGTAIDKFNRKTTIGRALVKTKAPDLLAKFSADPARQQKSASADHHVVISRHPYDVAGMTSHGHSWYNESCMNFHSGAHKHYLENDVRHGTHIAYLVHKDDKDIEKPLARIALKPFNGMTTGDTILRQDRRTYGNAPDAFSHTVNKWVNKHFPGTKDVYAMVHPLNNETGHATIFHKDAIDAGIGWLAENKDNLDSSLSNHQVASSIVNHPNLTPDHIHKLMDLNSEDLDINLSHSARMGAENINRAITEKREHMFRGVGNQENATSGQLRRIADMGHSHKVINNQNLHGEDLDHVVGLVAEKNKTLRDRWTVDNPVHNRNLQPHHVAHLYYSTPDWASSAKISLIENHSQVPAHVVDHAARSSDQMLQMHAARHPKLSPSSMETLAETGKPTTRFSLALNPSLPSHVISHMINNPNEDDREHLIHRALMKRQDLKPEHVDGLVQRFKPESWAASGGDYHASAQALMDSPAATDTHRMIMLHKALAHAKKHKAIWGLYPITDSAHFPRNAGLDAVLDHVENHLAEHSHNSHASDLIHSIVKPLAARGTMTDKQGERLQEIGRTYDDTISSVLVNNLHVPNSTLHMLLHHSHPSHVRTQAAEVIEQREAKK